MTDKQKEAIKIVLRKYSERHLSNEEAINIIDAIIGEQQIQYMPQPITFHDIEREIDNHHHPFIPPYEVTCEQTKE